MYTRYETYSDLQRALDEREDLERYRARQIRNAERMYTVTQLGVQVFHHALGRQGELTLCGEA